MSLAIKAGQAFRWFGHDYAAGDAVDTTGWPQHAVTELMIHCPVYVDAPASTLDTVNSQASVTGAYTVPDVTVATLHRLVLTGAATLTFPAAAAGKSFTLVLVQDATGSRTVTWPGTVKWAGGTAPTLTTTANKADVISFVCADGTNWLGFVSGQNF